jgi:nucleotide-binding universal stress UspA family protein
MESEILVPLDGSPLAETSLGHALALARIADSAVRLLRVVLPAELVHTWSPDVPVETVRQQVAWAREAARAYLSQVAEPMRAHGLPVRCEVLVEEDVALAIVARAAKDPAVATIVMATHGRTGAARWVFGSVAEKVVHASTTPLLLIRPAHGVDPVLEPATYTTVLVPLDGSMFADQALRRAQKVAARANATLLLVTVGPPGPSLDAAPDEAYGGRRDHQPELTRVAGYLQQRVEQLEMEGLRVRAITAHGQPAEEILRVAAEERADLIVMASHGFGGIQQLWLGSVASKVLQGATLPVLLLRGWAPQPHAPEE